MPVAITREVSPSIARCELTHLERIPIDFERAREQHHVYEEALARLGCELHRLPAEPDLPDAVFVEDAAIVLDELAVVMRPGAESRRPETLTLAPALARHREVETLQAPGIMDGGDVLAIGKRIYVGLSTRSDREGVEQLERILAPHGYTVEAVEVAGCLHLKSAVTCIGPDRILINPAMTDAAPFASYDRIEVAPEEPHAANAVLVGEALLYSTAYPATLRRLEQAGLDVVAVDASELHKAEGQVTCCSLVFA